LILRGRGKHFSAGADLGWMRESAKLDYQANLADAHELGELMQRLYELPQPTLAGVQGAAFGGALGLIACCDMAIGASDALFCLSEVRIGLAPAVISPFVVKAIGERATRRYALTAERFDGTRASELGLLADTYPASELDAALEQWVANLLLNSPQALKACKDLLLEVGDGDFSADLRQRGVQFANHPGVEGIVLVRAVEPEGGHAACVFVQFDGLEIGHLLLPVGASLLAIMRHRCCPGSPASWLLRARAARRSRTRAYMRNTPKRVGSIGALRLADSASPSTSRVCAGSITPSSHSRALE
jgi:enoyl-CoA hydratase/carnithine racemase